MLYIRYKPYIMSKEIANLIIPQLKALAADNANYKDIAYSELMTLFPKRHLPEGAMVTRFAPSPTGFVHIGSISVSMFDERMATQTGGVSILRIEDTDKNREIENGVLEIVKALSQFGIELNEGYKLTNDNHVESTGEYGPYKQSDRLHFYHSFIHQMIENGLAYPCFVTADELNQIRTDQEKNKVRPGYYGEYAKSRNLTLEEIRSNIEQGKPFVIRFKSQGNIEQRITFQDMVRGSVTMPENDQDIVLLKSDGYPTYHFAHLVDDCLMQVSHVFRADEWLPSTPLHIQLFRSLELVPPTYGHLAPITKLDNGNKRKLSKRKDPEAAVSYYHQAGYPKGAIVDYLMNLLNANYEDWRKQNPIASYKEFNLRVDKTNVSGPLFDEVKLLDISKGIIAGMSTDTVIKYAQEWASEYDKELAEILLGQNSDCPMSYIQQIFSIERDTQNGRKDLGKWSELRNYISYFIDSWFILERQNVKPQQLLPVNVSSELAVRICARFIELYNIEDSKEDWFEKVKNIAGEFGFARDPKTFRQEPDKYAGQVGDVAAVLRIAITNRLRTPDLCQIMKVLGKDKVFDRLQSSFKA